MDSRQGGGFASCPFSSLGCGLRVSFRWRLVAGSLLSWGPLGVGPLCPNTHRVASHVRPHPISAVAARTTGEPTASRRQWRVGVPMADPMRPQGEKIAGQGRSGNDCSALGISQRPWPAKTLILLLRRDFSTEREIAQIWPVHQHVFPVGATSTTERGEVVEKKPFSCVAATSTSYVGGGFRVCDHGPC